MAALKLPSRSWINLRMAKRPTRKSDSTAHLGFEAKLWLAADKLRNNMDAAECKHVVLGLIFLKYITDRFEDHRANMNLAIRGIEADIGPEHADTFRRDLHPDLRADHVLANPPFNDSDWFRKDDDVRWRFGVPTRGNANFAWVQHFIHHLAPQGMAGFVLANGSMSSNQSGEGDIRRALIEADLVDCMVALPGQLFYSTQIPVCLWFLAKNKNADAKRGFRDRRQQTLFIDARKLGALIDRLHRELTDADLEKITSTYHAWRGNSSTDHRSLTTGYSDIPGFCKSATTAEIAAHGHVLTPGRYVGAEAAEDDGEPFEEKMPRLVSELHAQFAESAKLQQAIKANLKGLGYGG